MKKIIRIKDDYGVKKDILIDNGVDLSRLDEGILWLHNLYSDQGCVWCRRINNIFRLWTKIKENKWRKTLIALTLGLAASLSFAQGKEEVCYDLTNAHVSLRNLFNRDSDSFELYLEKIQRFNLSYKMRTSYERTLNGWRIIKMFLKISFARWLIFGVQCRVIKEEKWRKILMRFQLLCGVLWHYFRSYCL